MPERSGAADPAAFVPGATLRLALFLWVCEAWLARLTSDPQAPRDLVLSLAGLVAIALLPTWSVLGLRRFLPARPWRALLGAASTLPLGVTAAGVLYAPAAMQRPIFGPIAFLVALLLPATVCAVQAWRGGTPAAPAWRGAVFLSMSTLLGWWLLQGALPPLVTLLGVLGGYAVFVGFARRRVTSLLLVAVGFVFGGLPVRPLEVSWDDAAPPAGEGRPDVILLFVDTLRADTARGLEAYRRLAESGVEFPRVQAAGPWTLPSMATVMTGLPPWSHGAGSGPGWKYVGLSDETPVLAELLSRAGYDTAGLIHNSVCGEAFGFQRGFRVWRSDDSMTRWALPRTRKTHEARPFLAHVATALGLAGRRPFRTADDLVDEALQVVAARREDHPLFLWLQFYDVHFPYRHAEELSGVSWRRRMELERGDADLFRADPFWRSDEGQALLHRAYEAEARRVDRALMRLLDGLGPPPPQGRVVVLSSDHGEEFFEHGGIEHGHALWQELLAVPLVIQGLKGRAPGTVEDAVVAHVDLAPTLLAAAGLAPPPAERPEDRMPGRDLAAALEPRPAFSENLLKSEAPWDSEWAVRDDDWKFLYGPGPERVRIFDLARDPDEHRDLADDPGVLERLEELVRRYAKRPPRVERAGQAGGEAAMRALDQAGYVGGDGSGGG